MLKIKMQYEKKKQEGRSSLCDFAVFLQIKSFIKFSRVANFYLSQNFSPCETFVEETACLYLSGSYFNF